MILWVQTGFATRGRGERSGCKGEIFFMKNERFERYIYMGVTAILVLIAAVFVVVSVSGAGGSVRLSGKDPVRSGPCDLWRGSCNF